MNNKQRDGYIRKRLEYWLRFFRVDPDLKVSLKYATNPPMSDRLFAEVDMTMIPYGRATIVVYDTVFAESNEKFKYNADLSLCHEVMHIFFYPLIAYAGNMMGDNDGMHAELERIEESLITKMELALCGPGEE